MDSGTRSGMAAVPHASVGDVIPEASADQTSPRITAQRRAAVGTALAPREAVHPQAQFAPAPVAHISADRLSVIPLSAGRISVIPPLDHIQADASDRTRTRSVAHASIHMAASADTGIAGSAAAGAETAGADMAGGATAGVEVMGTAMAGVEAIGPATVGAAASSLGAAGVGASASAGPIMAATGARAGHTVGTPGGTTLTGIPRGHLITTIRRTRTPDTTIRPLTIPTRRMTMRRMTMTRRRATQSHRAWIPKLCISTSITTLARARIIAV